MKLIILLILVFALSSYQSVIKRKAEESIEVKVLTKLVCFYLLLAIQGEGVAEGERLVGPISVWYYESIE